MTIDLLPERFYFTVTARAGHIAVPYPIPNATYTGVTCYSSFFFDQLLLARALTPEEALRQARLVAAEMEIYAKTWHEYCYAEELSHSLLRMQIRDREDQL